MSLWRQLTHGLRALTNRTAADADVADEVQDYLDRAAAAHRARGLPPDEALRAARLEVGSPVAVGEDVRASGWENAVSTTVADVRYGARRLRRNPGFAAVTILTLALGIGATTAIFSTLNPILFEPLPYPHPERVALIWYGNQNGARVAQTFGTYREVAQRSHSFDAIAVMKPWQPTITGVARPERLEGQFVSAAYFGVLGVSPALGRDFQTADDQLKGPNVVVLSDALWRRSFGGDRTIVGRQVRLDDTLFTVIGVMPGTFENVLSPRADLWAPLQYDMSLGTAWGHHLRMVARLRPGLRMNDAGRELETIARTPVPEFPRVPWASLKEGFILNSLQGDLTAGVRPALLAILGAVLGVLAIACVNVTNLLLARGARQRAELAMRLALGAGRSRVVRQLLTESVLLAAVGGALGLALAEAGVGALVALAPPGLPRAGAIAVDRTVFAFALGVSVLIGLFVGLAPALQSARGELRGTLQHGAWRAADSHQVTRRVFVVAEVALALVLLVSAGLLLRSLDRLFAVNPGFNPSHLLTLQVRAGGRARDKATTDRFFAQVLETVRHVPGVASAAFTSQLPFSGDDEEYGAHFDGQEANVSDNVFRSAVSPGYLETIGVPLRRGRLLDERDAAGAPSAALISESLARRRFPGQDPIGRRLQIGPASAPWLTIVGVVGDVNQASLALGRPDAVYHTTAQSFDVQNALSLVVHARGNPADLASAVKDAIWSVDKDQPIARVATMDDLLAKTEAQRRFALMLFEVFAAAALALAAVGIYGILACSVAERTREIGVRTALGASRGGIVALVLRQGMMLAGLGTAIGLVGAAAASGALVTLLFGVSRLDVVTYAGVVAVLLGVSALACVVPAWRAACVDPTITLRTG